MTSVISPTVPVQHEHASSTVVRAAQLVVVTTATSHGSGSSLENDAPPKKQLADEYQEPLA